MTYYGTQVGNFVISVNGRYEAGLSLYDDSSTKNYTTRLVAKPLKDGTDSSLAYIPENIDEGDGSKNSNEERNSYLAYTFYLVNSGEIATNINMNFTISRATKDVDQILRVMIIKDGETTIYAKPQQNDDGTLILDDAGNVVPEKITVGRPGEYICPSEDLVNDGPCRDDDYYVSKFGQFTTPFATSTTVVNQNFEDVQVNETFKFTVVMWLDGWDKQQSNDMLGGAIQTKLTFSIY